MHRSHYLHSVFSLSETILGLIRIGKAVFDFLLGGGKIEQLSELCSERIRMILIIEELLRRDLALGTW